MGRTWRCVDLRLLPGGEHLRGGRSAQVATSEECEELPDWAKLHMLFGEPKGRRTSRNQQEVGT